MTGPGRSYSEAFSKFSDEVDRAVSRARRAAAEVKEDSAKFRQATRALADRARAGEERVPPAGLTADRLREAAVGFRTEHGLPVEQYPAKAELTLSPREIAARNAPVPPTGDDDEDFSQERIMS